MKKMGSILGLKIGLAIFCAMAAMSSAAFAEDAKPAAPAISADDLKKALGLSIYLQAGYTYNGNAGTANGDSEQNDFRVFDHKANSFTLDLAQIVFVKDPALGNAGYKLKLSAGETAKWIHSRGLSGAPSDRSVRPAKGPILSMLPRRISAITRQWARGSGSTSGRWSPSLAPR